MEEMGGLGRWGICVCGFGGLLVDWLADVVAICALVVAAIAAAVAAVGDIMPEVTGGGKSSASAALRASWCEKSLACHHSRNFRANMEVGRKIFSDPRRCGYMFCGLRKLNAPRGLALGASSFALGGCVASSIAAWSAGPSLRIRVPMSQRNGDEYFVLSNR